MSIRKVMTKDGESKWEVRLYRHGRSGGTLRRRFDKRNDADEFLFNHQQKTRDSLANPDKIEFKETTFAKEASYWLDHKKDTLSPSHVSRVKGILEELLPTYGLLAPAKFHSGLLTDLQQNQLEMGLAFATVNRKIEVIKAILQFSVNNCRVQFNPAIGFKKLKNKIDDISFWEEEEASAFLEFASKKYPPRSADRWVYVVYLTGLNTGMRAGELWGLQPSDILKSGETIFVKRQFDKVKKDFRPTKGKKARHVPCNMELMRELFELIANQRTAPNAPIFTGDTGNPIRHEVFVRKYFLPDLAESGVKRIRFHDLRHTAFTLMIARGLEVNVVQAIGGHENISTTMMYVHLVGSKIKDAARRFSITPRSSASADPNLLPFRSIQQAKKGL